MSKLVCAAMSELNHRELIREYRLQHGDLVMLLACVVAPGVLFTQNRFRTWQFRVADLFTVVLFFAIMCASTPWVIQLNWWRAFNPSVFALLSIIPGLFGAYVAKERAWTLITPQWAVLWGLFVPDMVSYFSGA